VRNERIRETDFKYTSCSKEILENFLKKVDGLLEGFATQVNIKTASIMTYNFVLEEIRIRLDQRVDYYQYFHFTETNIKYLSRTREVALLCYWIIKYKPFYIEQSLADAFWKRHHCTINERFALYLIESYTLETYSFLEKKAIHFFSPENRRVILYNFTHRDISKEAFILFVGSLISTLEI